MFPRNVISLIQPTNQEVIACFKNGYNSKFMETIIAKTVKITRVKNVINMIVIAWDELPLATLKKSWQKPVPYDKEDTKLFFDTFRKRSEANFIELR